MNYLEQIEEIGKARERILDKCKIKASILSLTESAKYLVAYKDNQDIVDSKALANVVFLGHRLYKELSNKTVDMSPYTLSMMHSTDLKYRQLVSYKSYIKEKHTSLLGTVKSFIDKLNPFSKTKEDIEFTIIGSVFAALNLASDTYGTENKVDREMLELLLTLCLTTLYDYLGIKTTNYTQLLTKATEAINEF